MTLQAVLIKIPVSDLDLSTAFYTGALGLEVTFSSTEFGWAQLSGASLPLALYVPGKGGGTRAPGGSVDVHFGHGDVEALHRRVEPMAADAAVHTNADGSRSLEFTDPDGNLLKIMQT